MFLIFLHFSPQLDSRIRPFICCLKKWASSHGINQAKDCTFSSYVLTLLAIHYLQVGTASPVIPSLQTTSPGFFDRERNIFDLEYESPMPDFKSDNKSCLGESGPSPFIDSSLF